MRIASAGRRSRSVAITADICSGPGSSRVSAQVALVLAARGLEQPGAGVGARRLERAGGGREGLEAGDDPQLGRVHGADLVGVGMHVDQALGRRAGAHERVAGGRDLAQAPADGQQQVGLADALGQRRVHRQRGVPGVGGRGVVDVVLAAERGGDGHRLGLGEGGDVGAGLRRPAALPHDRQRRARLRQQRAEPRDVAVGAERRRRSGRCGAASGTSTSDASMSSGSATTTGPGRPDVATAKARAMSSGTRSARSICVTHLAIEPKTAR